MSERHGCIPQPSEFLNAYAPKARDPLQNGVLYRSLDDSRQMAFTRPLRGCPQSVAIRRDAEHGVFPRAQVDVQLSGQCHLPTSIHNQNDAT